VLVQRIIELKTLDVLAAHPIYALNISHLCTSKSLKCDIKMFPAHGAIAAETSMQIAQFTNVKRVEMSGLGCDYL
jgi:hypothetical protein